MYNDYDHVIFIDVMTILWWSSSGS